MLQALRKRVDEDEQGFTLIELLVVVIIIGILAAIAIPVFLNQRERAWRSAVQSDLRNIAIEMESAFTDLAEYPDVETDEPGGEIELDLEAIDNDAENVTRSASPGVTIGGGVHTDDSNAFCLWGTHENLDEGEGGFIYDSLAGGVSGYEEEAEDACP